MARHKAADFLVEIGIEELPPKALTELMHAFAANLAAALDRERLSHGELEAFASPRRLAVRVADLAPAQQDRETELRGPPVSAAFDANGVATQAAGAFAKRCGVSVSELGRTSSPKGEWLSFRAVEQGRRTAALMPALVQEALDKLPVSKRMRWGDSEIEFVRPVHWVLMLHGHDVVSGQVAGLAAGNVTRGHRFLADGEITVGEPAQYLRLLEERGFVLADFAVRRQRIVTGVQAAAAKAGGVPVASDALYDEVAALTEWPVALTGRFDESYLQLPREVIVATLTSHQRYFPIADRDGRLLARFVTVANLESEHPDVVREGNERVIRPRLADAAFFQQQDRRRTLGQRCELLKDVVYSQGLGSLYDKSRRVATLAGAMAERLHADAAVVERAAALSRCDLLTGMVGEFPELQGVMGRYYARDSGEPDSVAQAIGELYLPRFSGDVLPATTAGQILALADKIDTLAGYFALGKKPSGNRDPFGLRRAALGVVRIAVERQLDLDLPALLAASHSDQPVAAAASSLAPGELYDFIVERMRTWYAEKQNLPTLVFDAVKARSPASLLDFDARLQAVSRFIELAPAESLAAANKRIANILRQADATDFAAVDAALLDDPAEEELYRAINAAGKDIEPLLQRRAYADALVRLADLRRPVDRFFDEVMVITDDEKTRQNRLALLGNLRAMFLQIADISRLSIG
ncbi:MAG: glycine--tRNA ligase subunit beta [Woeseiaceae bacterium]